VAFAVFSNRPSSSKNVEVCSAKDKTQKISQHQCGFVLHCHKKDRERSDAGRFMSFAPEARGTGQRRAVGEWNAAQPALKCEKKPRAGTRSGLHSSCCLNLGSETERCGLSGDGGAAQSAFASTDLVRRLRDCNATKARRIARSAKKPVDNAGTCCGCSLAFSLTS
jgi:hypothetical protein